MAARSQCRFQTQELGGHLHQIVVAVRLIARSASRMLGTPSRIIRPPDRKCDDEASCSRNAKARIGDVSLTTIIPESPTDPWRRVRRSIALRSLCKAECLVGEAPLPFRREPGSPTGPLAKATRTGLGSAGSNVETRELVSANKDVGAHLEPCGQDLQVIHGERSISLQNL